MEDVNKRLRLLEIYAVISSTIFIVLGFAAFKQSEVHRVDEMTVGQLNVERINVVEKGGQLRAVISNADRMPDPIVEGKPFKTARPPGMIFYNGLGDECGGLIFGAVTSGDKYGAYGGFSFDQYRQSQAIGITYNDHNGSRQLGLSVWDRPQTSIISLMQKKQAISEMPASAEKESALKSLSLLEASPKRIFVGRDKDSEAKVMLSDTNGNARINMVVGANGTPRLDFLDSTGKVTLSLPAAAAKEPSAR